MSRSKTTNASTGSTRFVLGSSNNFIFAGTPVRFDVVKEQDTTTKNGVSRNITVGYQCITMMAQGYKDKSLEELRLEDYQLNPYKKTGTMIIAADEKELIAKKMLEEKIASDSTIVTQDGTKFECHKCFLIAQSPVFEAMLTEGRFREGEFHEIPIADISNDGVEAFLAFLYYRSLEKPFQNPQVALELLRAANKYDIRSLEKAMTVLIVHKPIEWFNISTAFQLFFFSKNSEQLAVVKFKSLQVLKSKSAELTASDEFKQLFVDADDSKREAARELSTALINM